MAGHSRAGRTAGKPLLTAWLLVLLRDGEERHGWGLVSELRSRGLGVEPGRAYRILRALEEAGAVSSQWAASVKAPKRRSYRITGVGRDRLDELAANVRATWALHDAFLQAYERPVAESNEASQGVSEVLVWLQPAPRARREQRPPGLRDAVAPPAPA